MIPFTRRVRGPLLALVLGGTLALTGCAAESRGDDAPSAPEAGTPSGTAGPSDATAEQDAASDDPRIQGESCDWDTAALSADSLPGIPSGQEGELHAVIIGAWQHTHYDAGGGYQALADEDIRYVFPSTGRLLYCQHVPGVTEHRDSGADIGWEDTIIVLPGGAPGFIVSAWNDEAMVWTNRMDGSLYLLQRR